MSNNRISEKDRDLFRQAVGQVKPLTTDRLHLQPERKPSARPRHRHADFDVSPSAGGEIAPLDLADSLAYVTAGLQKNVLKQLRRGYFDIEAELDLHGLTAHEAKRQLLQFLHYAILDRLRCVHVIHGKGYRSPEGMPILKNKINLWLRQHHDVAAFCSSRPVHGGTGAVYVLLRA